MKVLVVHNHYRLHGGEDRVFAAEGALLERRSHEVIRYTVHNDECLSMGKLQLARATLWNGTTYRKLRDLIRGTRPDVAHFHNTLPLISPAAYYAAAAEGVPVVQTLHNYRLFCPGALFYRDQRVCEDCLGAPAPFPGVLHACYRGSRAATAVVAGMLSLHRAMRTWTRKVDRYIALTEFGRDKFSQGGLPRDKIVVKPHFVDPDPGLGEGKGGYALYVGRLSPEKGVDVLLNAWKHLGSQIPLKIVGDGPSASEVSVRARATPGVECLGWLGAEEVASLMKDAILLIFPSLWYETFGLVLVEAFAVGLPVVASKLGGMASMIEHGRTGLHFTPGDPEDLARQVEHAVGDPGRLALMRGWARAEYEAKYTADRNCSLLLDIYRSAMESRRPG